METSMDTHEARRPQSPGAQEWIRASNSHSMHSETAVDLAVIGGGISGLATAYYARQYWQDATGDALRIAVLEGSDQVGGKVQTEVVDTGSEAPFVIEAGPDSFLTQKPWALELARALGMEDELMGTNDDRRKVFVLQGDRLTPMPDGLQLIVPTRMLPFITSPLLSPVGKLRMAMDLVLPARRDEGDETLADFVTRRLGREALDKLAEPLMSGIYSAEADRQSILATFPRFREMERNHGSLIRAMLAAGRSRRQSSTSNTTSAQATGRSVQSKGAPAKPPAAFVTPVQGTAELIRRLAATLDEQIQTEAAVAAIEHAAGATGEAGYRLTLVNGTQMWTRALVVAVPAGVAAQLLASLAPQSATDLASIRYVSTVTLSLAYGPGQIDHPMNGFGVMIPHSEGRQINAITWTSSKFDRRAPDGHRLLRVFLGGSRKPEVVQYDDAELVRIARAELASIMGVTAEPLFHRLFRWQDASPQYDVGHLDLVARIEAGLPAHLFVTGSPYRGIGIPDCVHQAQQTARQVVAALTV